MFPVSMWICDSPFSCRDCWRLDDKLLGLCIIRCSRFELLNVGTVTQLSLHVATDDLEPDENHVKICAETITCHQAEADLVIQAFGHPNLVLLVGSLSLNDRLESDFVQIETERFLESHQSFHVLYKRIRHSDTSQSSRATAEHSSPECAPPCSPNPHDQ